ncbi:MAG: co-chaperone GroES [Nitrospinota bacterium]
MSIKPLFDRILVKQLDESEQKKGGIIIPDSAKTKSQEGEVIAVGEGKILENGSTRAVAVKKGDKIIFAKYSGTEIKLDGVEYLLLREDDVLGILA